MAIRFSPAGGLSIERFVEESYLPYVSPPSSREAAIFDEEAMRLVFDQLDDRLREIEVVRVTNMDWLVGDIRLEFGTLMRAFRSRGGRVEIEKGQT